MKNKQALEKKLVLQLDQTDCGVACLLTLIQYYGGVNSIEKLRELSGTNKEGTTLLGLYQAANKLGLTAEGCEADIQALIEHKRPVILHVILPNNLQHYVVCFGHDAIKKVFYIGDPAKGLTTYTEEELNKVWKSKTCLTLEPNESFIQAEEVTLNKKKWFLNLIREDKLLLVYSVVLGLIIATLGMVMAIFSQKLIDDILPSNNLSKLATGIVLVGFLLIVRVGLGNLREYFLLRQTKDFNNRIIDSFFGSLLRLPKSFFDTRKIGELVARLNDTQRIQRVIRTVAGDIVIDALVVLISFGFLFFYSWKTGIIALISLPFYFYVLYRFNNKIIKAQRETMQGYAYSESNFISTMQGISAIKNTNKQGVFQQLNQLIYGAFQEKAFELGTINVRLSLISGTFGVLFLITILIFNTLSVFHGKLQLGELMAILGIAGSLLPAIANLALITIPINEAKVAFNRMFEFASAKKETSGSRQVSDFYSLKVERLSFRFPGRKKILENVDFSLRKGECIAVVGESGAGKSTLGQIIQRLYGYEDGSILVNSKIPLNEVHLEDWRNIIGVIPQEVNIFNGTILDNILLGQEDKIEDVVKFCRDQGFERFIEQLPQGYATIVGEEGINLSGGQKQIIAFIRALYRKPQILILDEATAALDRNTEKFILELLQELKGDLAIFLISHRLQSLKNLADEILILEEGKISAKGNHEVLMQTTNFYSDYWKEINNEVLYAS